MIDKEQIISAIKTVFDPEIPVNVWDLGLIYDIVIGDRKQVTGSGKRNIKMPITCHLSPVTIAMTMTSPTCTMAEEIMQMVRIAVSAMPGVKGVDIKLVWDPPWDISRMSEVARLELDLTEEGW